MAIPPMTTYHCICNELAIAVRGSLEDLDKRSRDKAAIGTIPPMSDSGRGNTVLFRSTHVDEQPIVLKLEDGFEKRYAVRCGRCDLQIGYMLDKASFDEAGSGKEGGKVYLLPGGLMNTGDMNDGRDMSKEVELVAGAAG